MIPYSIYKIIHLVGVMMVFLSLGGVTMQAIVSGERENAWRKPAAITHGVGLLLALVGGFGLLARLGVTHGSLPGWVIAKIAIWSVFAILTGVVVRKKFLAKPVWFRALLLGGIAAYLAGSKPF